MGWGSEVDLAVRVLRAGWAPRPLYHVEENRVAARARRLALIEIELALIMDEVEASTLSLLLLAGEGGLGGWGSCHHPLDSCRSNSVLIGVSDDG